MGWIRHHAIIVTGWDKGNIEKHHKKAKELFTHVSEPINGVMNDDWSFFVPPDGSKEGWETSNRYDVLRDEFIKYLEDSYKQKTSNFVRWVEVAYGECEASVTRSNSD